MSTYIFIGIIGKTSTTKTTTISLSTAYLLTYTYALMTTYDIVPNNYNFQYEV